MATAVTRKGQVTIPKPIRDRLGIEPGSAVDFQFRPGGDVVLVKVDGERPDNPFERWRGSADAGLGTDEIMAMLRGE